jgi:hypothetical protein
MIPVILPGFFYTILNQPVINNVSFCKVGVMLCND